MIARRLGRFTIPVDMIERHPNDAMMILDKCIVLRAECLWYRNVIDYIAIHPAFRLILMAEEPPLYVRKITRFDDGTHMSEWEPAESQANGGS